MLIKREVRKKRSSLYLYRLKAFAELDWARSSAKSSAYLTMYACPLHCFLTFSQTIGRGHNGGIYWLVSEILLHLGNMISYRKNPSL